LVILIYFTMPETSYRRINLSTHAEVLPVIPQSKDDVEPIPITSTGGKSQFVVEGVSSHVECYSDEGVPAMKTRAQRLALFSGTYTDESLFKIATRPLVLVLLPPVLWATLVNSAIVGCFVALSANFATAFQEFHGWVPWQSGLAYVSVAIGAGLGMLGGGWFSDVTADWLTRRNGGIREPEMRLPTLMLSAITTPVAMIMYGVGLGTGAPWIVPVIGLGFCM